MKILQGPKLGLWKNELNEVLRLFVAPEAFSYFVDLNGQKFTLSVFYILGHKHMSSSYQI